MKLYITNIAWDYDPMFFTEEEANSIPTRIEIEVDAELCDSTDMIFAMYHEEINSKWELGELDDFQWSLLGYNLDILETITLDVHKDWIAEYRLEESYWDDLSPPKVKD